MPNVAFLVVGSPNAGFYSQVAAINLAITAFLDEASTWIESVVEVTPG